jgi:hypothetical protein
MIGASFSRQATAIRLGLPRGDPVGLTIDEVAVMVAVPPVPKCHVTKVHAHSNIRSPTFRKLSENRTYIVTTSRITFGGERK